jgi:hypothetical protein
MPISMLLLAAVLMVGGACGASSGFADDQPSDQGSRLEAGELAGLPRPAAAAPFGAASQRDGAVTQSFKVTGLSPADVLQFYVGALPAQGWEGSTVPVEQGQGVWRGEWTRNDRILQITAEPDVDDGTGHGDGAPTSQLDLELRGAPRGD